MEIKVITAAMLAVFASIQLPVSVLAQSLDVKNPAPLQSGNNQGTADSFVGSQFWYFIAEPGSFSGQVTKLDSPGSAIRAALGAGAAFAPKLPGSVINCADKGNVTTFSGTTKERNKVVVMIDPGPSGLVRAACNYEVHVGGNVSFGSASTQPGIIGTYMSMHNDYGLTKFKADGTLVCASGVEGKWTLFDDATKTYVVNVGQERLSLKLVPGRGLVDAASTDIVIFKLEH